MKNISKKAGYIAVAGIVMMVLIFICAMITQTLIFNATVIIVIIVLTLICLFLWIFYDDNDEDSNNNMRLISS